MGRSTADEGGRLQWLVIRRTEGGQKFEGTVLPGGVALGFTCAGRDRQESARERFPPCVWRGRTTAAGKSV
jgi:hypothetical protein